MVLCDYQGAVALVNSGCSWVPKIMHLLRCSFFIWAIFQFTQWAVHVLGRDNELADVISCDHLAMLPICTGPTGDRAEVCGASGTIVRGIGRNFERGVTTTCK